MQVGLYCYLRTVWLYHIFFPHLINGTIFWRQIVHKMCVLTFSTTLIWNISHSKENSARCYRKGLPQQAEVAQGVPGRLRPWIFWTLLWHSSLRVQTRPKPLDFYGLKNPQHAFLRRGSKRICSMSQLCGM